MGKRNKWNNPGTDPFGKPWRHRGSGGDPKKRDRKVKDRYEDAIERETHPNPEKFEGDGESKG